jgi:hypothetical protein
VQDQRLGHPVAPAEDVDPAVVGLADRLVPLVRVVGPGAGHPAGEDRRRAVPPEQQLQVVALQLGALGPARPAGVRHLDQLQAVALRALQRLAAAPPDAAGDQGAVVVSRPGGEQRLEVVGVPGVVAGR